FGFLSTVISKESMIGSKTSVRNPTTVSTRGFLSRHRRRYFVPITHESLVPPGRLGSWLLFWPGPLLTTIVRFESFLTDELGAGRVSMTIFSGVAASLRFWTLTFRPAFSAIRRASTSVFPTTGGTRVSPIRKIKYTVTIALSPKANTSATTIPSRREIVTRIRLASGLSAALELINSVYHWLSGRFNRRGGRQCITSAHRYPYVLR